MKIRWLQRVWVSIHEPRFVTILIMLSYLIGGFIGIYLLINDPLGPREQALHVSRLVAAVMLLYGACTGIPTAWTGSQWLERSAALALGGGMGVTALQLWAAHLDRPGPMPWVSISAFVMCSLFGFTRFMRVYQNPYKLGAGPLLPEQRTAVEEILERDNQYRRTD